MKKALLGLSNNISNNINKIKVWSQSFKKYCDHPVILLVANGTDEDLKLCESYGIKPILVNIDDEHRIFHKRLEKILEFLIKSDIELFIITDVFDVVFQNDPFVKLDTSLYNIFISGEGIDVCNEPWNTDNINKLFPNELEKCFHKEVICSGVIAGKRLSLIELYNNMFQLCENSTNNHNIQDQAALIVLVYSNKIHNLKIFNLDEAWAMHCAVAGPTHLFESWNFKNNIKYSIPYLKNNIVYTNHIKYDIVHQFNRIPDWNRIITQQYT